MHISIHRTYTLHESGCICAQCARQPRHHEQKILKQNIEYNTPSISRRTIHHRTVPHHTSYTVHISPLGSVEHSLINETCACVYMCVCVCLMCIILYIVHALQSKISTLFRYLKFILISLSYASLQCKYFVVLCNGTYDYDNMVLYAHLPSLSPFIRFSP